MVLLDHRKRYRGRARLTGQVCRPRRIDIRTGRPENVQGNPECDAAKCRLSSEPPGAIRRDNADSIDVWPFTLMVGPALPTVPLFLATDLCLPLDLEGAYIEACRRLRLP